MRIKILYLYSEVMGYTLATIKELSNSGSEVHVVHWDTKKLTPFQLQPIDNVTFYPRSTYSTSKIKELVDRVKPDLAVISGWQDKGYLKVARLLRKKAIPVVTGLDSQWHGSVKQYLAAFLSPFFKIFYSHAWVSGPYQFEYTRRLGFKKCEIVFDLYSADLALYNDIYNQSKITKQACYPHRFIFVGRFENVKAVDLLAAAWLRLEGQRKDWELHLIGSGSLKSYLQGQAGITIHDFMQPDRLKYVVATSGCFILPSRHEPWGVVIHEFAAAGLPIICSDVCGAVPMFVIHGLNGYWFESENMDSLVAQMMNIINSDDRELCAMSDASHLLGQRITPSSSAANLLTIIRGQL